MTTRSRPTMYLILASRPPIYLTVRTAAAEAAAVTTTTTITTTTITATATATTATATQQQQQEVFVKIAGGGYLQQGTTAIAARFVV